MAYQIATSDKTGAIFVVVANSANQIVRIVRRCDDSADATRLLRDLSGWRF